MELILTSYQARFYGILMDFIGNKKRTLQDFLSHRYRFSIFDLSDARKMLKNFSIKV
jgi:phenylacetate-CoA ligase